MPADITSPSNERIKRVVRLRDRGYRDAEGVFLVEGERLYLRALEAGLIPEVTLVSTESGIESTGPTVTVDPAVLDKASYRRRSQGVIGVFAQLDTRLAALDLSREPVVLVAENIEKPGNLGAMLRTAGAAGIDALVAVGGGVDAHNPNVVRASTGALFTVPLAVTDWGDLEPWLEKRSMRVICASPTATGSVWDTRLTGAVALVVGAEDEGLSDRAVAIADECVLIPQVTEKVDSLNVSVAAAVLLFEARRQRTN